ncbi:MAG: hypothetical protein ABSH44_08455 [Bryobacteraceae bacterium]|jgi:hypothetical protein
MLETRHSVCALDCPDCCSLLVTVENGRGRAGPHHLLLGGRRHGPYSTAETLDYAPPRESRHGDPALRRKYPLELISPKNDDSMNSTFGHRDAMDLQTATLAGGGPTFYNCLVEVERIGD